MNSSGGFDNITTFESAVPATERDDMIFTMEEKESTYESNYFLLLQIYVPLIIVAFLLFFSKVTWVIVVAIIFLIISAVSITFALIKSKASNDVLRKFKE